MKANQVVLGVDGGGTNTRCLIGDLSNRIHGEGHAGPSNYQAVGRETAAANLAAAIRQALSSAGRSEADVAAVCAGLAGAGRPENRAVALEMLTFLAPARIQVVTDAQIALAGALAGEPGVIIIAGTGSIAFGANATGETARAGGWGWILGDEGGGYDIGRRALVASLAAVDGSAPETDLGAHICTAWGLDRLEQVIIRVHSNVPASRGEIAALAPMVMKVAGAGDPVASAILREAGRALGLLAVTVLRRLGMSGGEPSGPAPLLSTAGGILTTSPSVLESLQQFVAGQVPASRFVPCRESPAQGAVRMALLLARRRKEPPHDVALRKTGD